MKLGDGLVIVASAAEDGKPVFEERLFSEKLGCPYDGTVIDDLQLLQELRAAPEPDTGIEFLVLDFQFRRGVLEDHRVHATVGEFHTNSFAVQRGLALGARRVRCDPL